MLVNLNVTILQICCANKRLCDGLEPGGVGFRVNDVIVSTGFVSLDSRLVVNQKNNVLRLLPGDTGQQRVPMRSV